MDKWQQNRHEYFTNKVKRRADPKRANCPTNKTDEREQSQLAAHRPRTRIWICPIARVVPDARFREDLEADSLDLVELIMAFEEEFGGEITDEDAQRITTVGQAVEYITTNMGG